MTEPKVLIAQLRICADCAADSPNGKTYLNEAARPMMRQAADEIERLTNMHQDMCRVAGGQVDEIARLTALLDPPVCRLQFPDGHVPGDAKEAAEGWKKWADEFERRWKAAKEALRDYQYSGGADWSQMAADVDRGRGQ